MSRSFKRDVSLEEWKMIGGYTGTNVRVKSRFFGRGKDVLA
ncbi:hypothetical protein [Paenibacillus luteus]|nr:hypothetical protein [Paenibacillus luteus]